MASLFKKGPSWYLSWYEEGKRRYRCVGKIEKYANLALKDLEVQLARNKAGFPEDKENSLSVEARISRYLDKVRANGAPKTIKRYKAISDHLIAYFGDNGSVTPEKLEAYKEHRISEGAKTQTVNLEVQFVKSVWKDSNGQHPFHSVKRLKVKDSKEIRFLSKKEVQSLVEHADEEYRDYLMGYLYTGARKEELLKLTWEDWKKGHLRLTNIKTQRAYKNRFRWIPVHSELKCSVQQ